MKRLLALLTLLALPVHAATINAASASRTDVNTAIASASAGDIVVVPAGTASWSGGVTISGITLQGPGKDAGSPTTVTAGLVTVTKHATQYTVLRGFRFTGTDAHLDVAGDSDDKPFIISQNYFNIAETDHGINIGANGGLINSNEFIGPLSLLQTGGNAIASTLGATAAASAEWTAAQTMGTNDTTGEANTYIEDNTITNLRDGWDCDDGSKSVFRHNTLNDSSIITHGGGSGNGGNDSSSYGCRSLEIYNNTFNRVSVSGSDGPINRWVWFRGSSGVVATNDMDEANASPEWTSGQQLLLSVGNCAGGYPRPYQVGQQTVSTDATPDYPILIMGNTGFGIPANEIDVAANPNTTCSNPGTLIVSGRDYSTNNAWAWVPYEYPHPLASGIGGGGSGSSGNRSATVSGTFRAY